MGFSYFHTDNLRWTKLPTKAIMAFPLAFMPTVSYLLDLSVVTAVEYEPRARFGGALATTIGAGATGLPGGGDITEIALCHKR